MDQPQSLRLEQPKASKRKPEDKAEDKAQKAEELDKAQPTDRFATEAMLESAEKAEELDKAQKAEDLDKAQPTDRFATEAMSTPTCWLVNCGKAEEAKRHA